MCLYPKLIKNKKYLPNKKNNWNPPKCTDHRVLYITAACGKCLECRKQKQREWLVRMTNLKKSLEDRMAALIASSKYLQDKIAKEQTGKIAAKAPEIEPVEDEDEDVVAENYEYVKRQLQYRAGIIR